jgi:hypothetical protein
MRCGFEAASPGGAGSAAKAVNMSPASMKANAVIVAHAAKLELQRLVFAAIEAARQTCVDMRASFADFRSSSFAQMRLYTTGSNLFCAKRPVAISRGNTQDRFL